MDKSEVVEFTVTVLEEEEQPLTLTVRTYRISLKEVASRLSDKKK